MTALEFANQHRSTVYAGFAALIIGIVLVFFLTHSGKHQPPPPPPPVTMVVIQPPKPPPPPPPLPQPKTIVQPKMVTPVQKPIVPNTPPKPSPPKAAPSAPALGTSLKANGANNAFDLSGNAGGNGLLGSGDGGGGGGGTYEGTVEADITAALQQNPVTRKAAAGLVVRVWVDASGVVTRVAIDKSSGDATVDDAVQNQVLHNLQLPAPPPNTPMPMTMSLTGEQPL